jgi:hypothetical protein
LDSFHIATLENAQDASTNCLFLVDGIEIQKSQARTKIEELVVETKIQKA